MSATEPDDFEARLREILHSRDTRPAGFTAGQVVEGGRRRRRTRTMAASGLAVVAVAAVLGVGLGAGDLVGGQGRGRHDDGPAVTPAPRPTSATPFTAAPAGPPRTLSSPETVDMGGGFKLRLTKDSAELLDPQGGSVGPDYAEPVDHQAPITSLMASGQGIASVYSGVPQVASAVVSADGRAYPAKVLRLSGHPYWSVAYVVLPPGVPIADILITVFDAAGKPLATDPPPGMAPASSSTGS